MSSPAVSGNSQTNEFDQYAPVTKSSSTSSMANETMFLQLLVAQLKNQDPLSPTDSMQFISQLAQFSQLEQSVNANSSLTGIRGDLDQMLPASTANSTSKS